MDANDLGDDDAVLDGALEGFGERLQPSRNDEDACTLATPPGSTAAAAPEMAPAQPTPSQPPVASGSAPSQSATRFDPLRTRGRGDRRPAQRSAGMASGAALDEAAFDGVAKDLADLMAGFASEQQVEGGAEQRPAFAETLRHLQDATATHAAAGGGGAVPQDAATAKLMEALAGAMGQQAGGTGGAGGEGGMDAFVESMMSQLLCKDVLYEPMKEIAVKFPPWLEAHRGGLTAEEAAGYEVQIEHIEGVCEHLEKHGDGRFDDLLSRLQKLQELGQPPEDLIKGLSASQAGDGGAGLPPFLSDPSAGGAGGCPVQ